MSNAEVLADYSDLEHADLLAALEYCPLTASTAVIVHGGADDR